MTNRAYITCGTYITILFFLLFSGCASVSSVSKETSEGKTPLSLIDISSGLPVDGLWRQNIALYDMNGDGFLDIVAPPPRKAKEGWKRPFIFLWNPSERKWAEEKYEFPAGSYSYGGIAVGDLNGDGFPDLVLAQHGEKIVLFRNDGGKRFVEEKLPSGEHFKSRAVVLSDITGDGRLDIIAASEGSVSKDNKPEWFLLGINKGNNEWDVKIIDGDVGLSADSVAAGNLRGQGKRDIAAAFLTPKAEDQKLIWFGDGNGDFKNFSGDLFGEMALPVFVKTGNVNGDGLDEVAFGVGLYGGGLNDRGRLAVLKWTGEGFKDIASGLDIGGYLGAFDLVDVDGDGRDELVVLTETGIHIFKYKDKDTWINLGDYPIPVSDFANASDLQAGRNKDGSVIIVLNRGRDESSPDLGIKAFVLK